MAKFFANRSVKIALVLLMALAAVSCGRRGALEAPPSSSVAVVDESGNETPVPEETVKEDKPFFLDALL